jgi:hypothetical protein
MKRNVLEVVSRAPAPVQARPVRETLPPEILAPLLAGARARGIADAYEMMGAGAVLLGHSGRVLHASERASRLLQDVASVVSEHLVGATTDANGQIESLIGRWLAGQGDASTVLEGAVLGQRISLRLVDVPQVQGESVQLLRAVIAVQEV